MDQDGREGAEHASVSSEVKETRRGYWITWNWSQRELLAILEVLGMKPVSPGRAARTFNQFDKPPLQLRGGNNFKWEAHLPVRLEEETKGQFPSSDLHSRAKTVGDTISVPLQHFHPRSTCKIVHHLKFLQDMCPKSQRLDFLHESPPLIVLLWPAS